jgi:anti-sigma28 factor (negative regulator of flagellin synthesis)
MRINPTALAALSEPRTRDTSPPLAGPAAQPSAVVSLSAAESAARGGPLTAEMEARVDRVRRRLAAGKYTVDLDRLAARILG